MNKIQYNDNNIMEPKNTHLPKPTNKFSVQKIQDMYLANLEHLVRVLSQFVVLLCNEDVIENVYINELNQLYTQLKYTEKMKNEGEISVKSINKYVEQALNLLKSRNQQFPKIKHIRSHNNNELATIVEENSISNYIKKNNRTRVNRHNNNSELQKYSQTLHFQSEVLREETKRSLENSRNKEKKSLYNELQKIKTKEPELYDYKLYHEPRRYNVRNRLPQYHLAKLI